MKYKARPATVPFIKLDDIKKSSWHACLISDQRKLYYYMKCRITLTGQRIGSEMSMSLVLHQDNFSNNLLKWYQHVLQGSAEGYNKDSYSKETLGGHGCNFKKKKKKLEKMKLKL